jgi:hypothetical protein
MADWTKGYESTPISEANAPNHPGDDRYEAPASKAKATKAFWKGAPPYQPRESED